MSRGSTSPAEADGTGTNHTLVKKAHDDIVTQLNKKRPRPKSALETLNKGRTLLDAAVSGAHEDLYAFCRWMEEEFRSLDHLTVPLRVKYCHGVLTVLNEEVGAHARDIAAEDAPTAAVASTQTLLREETPEGIIRRLAVAIGCVLDYVKTCSDDLPDELYTKHWAQLLGGLLSTFALGTLPSHEIAEMAAELLASIAAYDEGNMVRLLLGDDSIGPNFIGDVLRISQSSTLSVSMFQIANRMAVKYEPGDQRLALLRKIFPRSAWKAEVQTVLLRKLAGKNRATNAADFYCSLVNSAANDDSLVRPCGFRLVGLAIDGEDHLGDQKNQRRVQGGSVLVYVDPSHLNFKLFDPQGTECSISFSLKRVTNFTSASVGLFTFVSSPKLPQDEGVTVEFAVHEQDCAAFGACLLSRLEQVGSPPAARPTSQSGDDTAHSQIGPSATGVSDAPSQKLGDEDSDRYVYDDTDFLQLLEAVEAANVPPPEASATTKAEERSPTPPRESTALEPPEPSKAQATRSKNPATKSKQQTPKSRQSVAKRPQMTLSAPEDPHEPVPKPKKAQSAVKAKAAPLQPAAPRRSSRSAAAVSAQKIHDIAAAQSSSQSTRPCEQVPANDPSSQPDDLKQVSPAAPVTPPPEDGLARGRNMHLAEPSQVLLTHPAPPKGPYTYSKRSPRRLRSDDDSEEDPVGAAMSAVDLHTLPNHASDTPREGDRSDAVDESLSKAAAKKKAPLIKQNLQSSSSKSAKRPEVRRKQSKVDITAKPKPPVDASEGEVSAVEPPSNKRSSKVSAKPPRANLTTAEPRLADQRSATPTPASRRKSAPSNTKTDMTDRADRDELRSNSPLPWEVQDSADIKKEVMRGDSEFKIKLVAPPSPKGGRAESPAESQARSRPASNLKRGEPKRKSKVIPPQSSPDADGDVQMLEAAATAPSDAMLPSWDAPKPFSGSQENLVFVGSDDTTTTEVYGESTLVNDGPGLLGGLKTVVPLNAATSPPEISAKASQRDEDGPGEPGDRKGHTPMASPTAPPATSPVETPAESKRRLTVVGPAIESTPRTTKRTPKASKRKSEVLIDLTDDVHNTSSPLLPATSSPAGPHSTLKPLPSLSFDSLLDLHEPSFLTPTGDSHGGAISASEAQPRKRKSHHTPDVFGNVSTVASARTARESVATANTSTQSRPDAIHSSKLKPSLRSPPPPDENERPSKRTRFDLPPLGETIPEARSSAFGSRKLGHDVLKPPPAPPAGNKDLVQSLFTEFYGAFMNKIEAPSRAMQKTRRQIELSAELTMQKWIEDGNTHYGPVLASYEQSSALFNNPMRDILKTAKVESNKRHKRVQAICTEGQKKPVYPKSLL